MNAIVTEIRVPFLKMVKSLPIFVNFCAFLKKSHPSLHALDYDLVKYEIEALDYCTE